MALSFLKLPDIYNLTGNSIEVEVETDTTGVTSHYILLQIIIIDGETYFDKLNVINQKAKFDIAEFLKNKQKKNFSYYNQNILNVHNFLSSFRLIAYEQYNNDGNNYNNLIPENNLFYAIQGGISSELYKQFASTGQTFSSFFVENPRFLTWQQHNYKIVSKLSEERLYFLHTKDSLIIKVIITYNNNTEEIIDAYTKLGYSNQEIHEINTSFNILGLASYETETKKIISYSVFVTQATGEDYITEQFRYVLDEKYYNNEKQLFFKNSFGTYDTIQLKGIEQQDNEFEFDILQGSDRFKTNTSSEEKYTINSGWLSNLFKDCKKAAKYFKELFLSDDVYFIDDNNNIVKIIITNKTQKRVFKDGEYLYSFEIEYLTAEQEEFYSEIQPYELPNCYMIIDDLGNPTPYMIQDSDGNPVCYKINKE